MGQNSLGYHFLSQNDDLTRGLTSLAYLGVMLCKRPQKGGVYDARTTPAPALDLATSLRGDFATSRNPEACCYFLVGSGCGCFLLITCVHFRNLGQHGIPMHSSHTTSACLPTKKKFRRGLGGILPLFLTAKFPTRNSPLRNFPHPLYLSSLADAPEPEPRGHLAHQEDWEPAASTGGPLGGDP